MRIPICILALVVSSWAATAETPVSVSSDSTAPATTAAADSAGEQAAQAPADQAKPADTPPAAPPAKYGGWTFSGLADAYVTRNGNHPSSDLNGLQNFDLHSGDPRFSLGKFTIDKSDKVIGIHVDVGVGETMRLIHATDVSAQEHKGLRYFEQMYAIVKPNHLHGTEIDFGQFVTSAGAEVIESTSNWNYTRSLLFALAIPYYHFGFKVATPVTKELTVGFQVVNAWNTVWGSHDLQNVGITAALTKAKYTWSVNYYVGATDPGPKVGKRNLLDSAIVVNPTSKLSFYANGDWGRNNRYGGGYDQWYGLAGAARYQLTKIFAVAGRAEFFNDANGFTTGLKQTLKEGTATAEGKIHDHFVGRLEFRHDASDHPYFDRGRLSPNKSQNTLTLGIVALLGPLK
jgi:hypothetical protein